MALKIQDIETLDKLIEEQDRLSEAIASDKLILENIRKEVNETQDKLSWVLDVLKRTDERKVVVSKELEDLIVEKESLFVSVNELKTKIINLQNEITELNTQKSIETSKLKTEREKIQEEVLLLKEGNKKNIDTYNADVLIIKSQISSLKINLSNINSNIETLERKRVELDRLILDRQNMLNSLNEKYVKLSTVDEELKNKNREIKVTEQKLNSLKLQIKLERENGKNSD